MPEPRHEISSSCGAVDDRRRFGGFVGFGEFVSFGAGIDFTAGRA
jgi:hypothetical protein